MSNSSIEGKRVLVEQFISQGFVLIPLKGKTKIPDLLEWQTTKHGQYSWKDLQDCNYGVALRPTDLVVDVDPRNFKADDKPVQRLVAEIGAPLKSFTVRTGGGGLHIYLKKPADLLVRNALKAFPGIEFKSHGRQVVGPACLHPDTQKTYDVVAGSPTAVMDAPEKLLELIQRTAVPFSELAEGGGTGTYVNDAATQGRYLAYLQDAAPQSGSFVVACKGRDLGLPPGTTLELMLEVWNPRRTNGPKTPEEMRVKVLHAYQYASGPVGSNHPAAQFDPLPESQTKTSVATAAGNAENAEEAEKKLAWDTTNQGGVKKTFQNLLNYLRLPTGGLFRIFAYNEFTGRIEFVTPAPWHRGRMPTVPVVSDTDLRLLKGYLATRHAFEASIQHIEEAVTNVAYNERFHPVREYLLSLRWDKKPRLRTWIRDFLGALDGGYPAYLEAVSRKVLCAAVMRVFKPGIKFDHVLVLEGAQDLGKSTAVEILGGPYSSDAPIDPHSRDTVDQMQGRWIIEMAEMEVLRKTEEEALKAFITRRTDRVRLAYGRSTGEYPRQCIFIATKNPGPDGTYLKDDTGNRRWWPVRCEPRRDRGTYLQQMDFSGLKRVRDQLFAEAVALVKTSPGEPLYMESAPLKSQAKDVADQRHVQHQWTDPIGAWIASCDKKPETRLEFITARDVYLQALAGSDKELSRKVYLDIASCMRVLGWVPTVRWVDHRSLRGYVRPDTVDTEALVEEL